jgi:rhamnogalacturonan acetylesterase
MKSLYLLPVMLVAIAVAAPSSDIAKRATPHVYLAGDSTMALGGGGSGTQGNST